MVRFHSPRLVAILQALFVTFLWSTSWVLIKIGLQDIPALTFAGLRYVLAFLCLLPLLLRSGHRQSIRNLGRGDWARLCLLGFILYTAAQGALFLSLAYLPAMTVTLLLNLTSIFVAGFGIVLLSERPTGLQWGGVGLNALGLLVYFFPVDLPRAQLFGLLAALVGVLTNAAGSLLGRRVNRAGDIHPLVVTGISMGLGAIALLVVGILVQGVPSLNLSHWGIIVWLAVVNTAFAFTLWNLSLQRLTAIESSIINSTMLVQIALLAWFFIGEELSWQKGIGLAFAGLGVVIVQWRGPISARNQSQKSQIST